MGGEKETEKWLEGAIFYSLMKRKDPDSGSDGNLLSLFHLLLIRHKIDPKNRESVCDVDEDMNTVIETKICNLFCL